MLPFSIIDTRISDLAISFWEAPGDRILDGYKRLEDLIRDRCDIQEHGSKLFSKAFMGEQAILCWPNINGGEQVGRAHLFMGAYGAYRNRRAHTEFKESPENQLSEFLVLNQLFRLEREANIRIKPDKPVDGENEK